MNSIGLYDLLVGFDSNIKVYRDYAADDAVEPYIVINSLSPEIDYVSGKPFSKTTSYELLLCQKSTNSIPLKDRFIQYLLDNNIRFYNSNENSYNDDTKLRYDLAVYTDLMEMV